MNINYLNKFFTAKNIMGRLNQKDIDIDFFIDEIRSNYLFLQNNYRNEYFYSNTLFNKIILGKHSLKTSIALRELIISKSRTDFVMINKKKSVVYEIKTDLDNLDRLITQINDYYKAFSDVYVVTSEKNYYPVYKLLKVFSNKVGIIVLSEKSTISIRKICESYYNDLSHEHLFKLLRKQEYENLLNSYYNHLPNVKQIEYYKTLLQMFKKIEITKAQDLVYRQLMNRNSNKDKLLFSNIPYEIRWIIYREVQSIDELIRINNIFIKVEED